MVPKSESPLSQQSGGWVERKERKQDAETARDTMRELHREKEKKELLLLMKRSQA